MARHLLCMLLVVACPPVLADGGFVPARRTVAAVSSAAARKAVLVAEPDAEVLLLETTYRGPASAFAWIIPVPQRPREVFIANKDFMDAVLRDTSPLSVEHIVRRSGAGYGGGRGGSGDGSSSNPRVRVLGRMVVGDYDAAIIAARQTGGEGSPLALVQWLQDNGYDVTERLAEVLEPYVEDEWVFVALKLQQGKSEETPLLEDVAPIGIRFPQSGRRLVFPLRISRLSAPPLTAIALVTISTQTYRCAELPVVRIGNEIEIHEGETYGDFRRRMCREPAPALLCEFRRRARLPSLALSYRAGGRVPATAGLGGRAVVSRFFAYLRPEEMEDLNLRPHTDDSDYMVLIERQGVGYRSIYDWEKGLKQFVADCGALPCKPLDLARAPTAGFDASGNRVPVGTWRGPYLDLSGYPHAPAAALDSYLSGWLCDPLDITFLDRADLAGTIRPATADECEAALRR